MAEEMEYGNIAELGADVGYIIGDNFGPVAQLPHVFTLKQFFKMMLDAKLPKYRRWIIGQGIDSSVHHALRLLGETSDVIHFQCALPEVEARRVQDDITWEWHHMHFTDATHLQAELKLLHASTKNLFTQDFIFSIAHELTQAGCEQAMPGGMLVTKQAQLSCFHRLFPLPIRVETQFHFTKDNALSLKSITRFYQNYLCAVEAVLHFDLHDQPSSQSLIYELGQKTFDGFSKQVAL